MSKKMPPGPLSAMSEARQSVDIRIPASSELNNLVRLGKWFANCRFLIVNDLPGTFF